MIVLCMIEVDESRLRDISLDDIPGSIYNFDEAFRVEMRIISALGMRLMNHTVVTDESIVEKILGLTENT